MVILQEGEKLEALQLPSAFLDYLCSASLCLLDCRLDLSLCDQLPWSRRFLICIAHFSAVNFPSACMRREKKKKKLLDVEKQNMLDLWQRNDLQIK
mmetsp:Transcript_16791/g.24861  ORF Transcript_16791/g.24861 Transcript_16791/m.24861 type:complete len:96 (+) Transcript_16791:346-633(+)